MSQDVPSMRMTDGWTAGSCCGRVPNEMHRPGCRFYRVNSAQAKLDAENPELKREDLVLPDPDNPYNTQSSSMLLAEHPTTEQAERVLALASESLDLFLRRNRDYGDAAEELGVKAQFVDMNRKFRKLKRALWEDQELVGESARETCMDLTGHCLLTIDMLDRGDG